MKLSTVIVDDEALARQVLREMLGKINAAQIEVAAECANGFEAVKAVTELKPGLLLLDIQMPKLDGFETLELVQASGPCPRVIFVTAHDQHALRAFEVAAADYLLKPFTQDRLEAAVERVCRGGSTPQASTLAAVARSAPLQRIVVRDGAKIIIIPVAKLEYAQAQDDYVALVAGEATAGKSVLKQQTIASLEVQLDPADFIRVHRSYLVRLDRIARLEADGADSHSVVLHGGARIPVSRSGLARLKSALGT